MMKIVGRSQFTSIEEGRDDDCIVDLDLGVIQDFAIKVIAIMYQAFYLYFSCAIYLAKMSS